MAHHAEFDCTRSGRARQAGSDGRMLHYASWMRICWIKGGGLVPPDFGGRIRSYHMVKALAERHDVTLVTFYREQADDPHEQLRDLFSGLVLAPLRLPASRSASMTVVVFIPEL